MEIILLEHVEKLGKMGDKVHVKSGYARNYLLPQNKALRATEANVAYFEKQRAELEARNKALFEEATKKAEELKGFSESWQQQGLQHDIAKAGLENLQGFGRKLVNLVIKNNQGEVGVFYKFRFDIFVKTVFRDKSL